VRIAVIGAILLSIARIWLSLSLPWVLQKVASGYGLRASYDRLDLTLLELDVELWQLEVLDDATNAEVVRVEYCRADVSIVDLFFGRLVVRRVEVDGLDAHIERDENGRIVLLARFASDESLPPVEEWPPLPEPRPIEFSLPLELQALRIQRVHARITDRNVDPPIDTRIDVDLSLSSLGSTKRDVRFDLRVSSLGLLDLCQIEGQGHAQGRTLDSSFRFTLRGLHTQPLRGYLAALGIRPAASLLAASGEATLAGRPIPGSEQGVSLSLAAGPFSFLEDEAESLHLTALRVEAELPSSRELKIVRAELEGGRVDVRRTAPTAFRIAGLEIGGPATATPSVPSATTVETSAAAPSAGASPAGPPPSNGPAIAIELGSVQLEDLDVRVIDETTPASTPIGIGIATLEFEPTTHEDDATTRKIAGRIRGPGLFDSGDFSVTLTASGAERRARAVFAASGITLAGLRPFLEPLGVEPVLEKGAIEATASLTVRQTPAGSERIDLAIESLRFTDGDELFALRDAKIEGLEFVPDGALRIASITAQGSPIEVNREADGALRLLGLRIRGAGSSSPVTTASAAATSTDAVDSPAPPGPPETGARRAFPRITIDSTTIRGFGLTFRDASVEPNAELTVTEFGIELREFELGASATEPRPARLEAWMLAPGLASEVRAVGTVHARPEAAGIELAITGAGLSAASLAPYVAAAGITPAWSDASLRGRLRADIRLSDAAPSVDLELVDWSLGEGAIEYAGAGRIALRAKLLPEGTIEIADVTLTTPRVRAGRREDGSLDVLGLRVDPRAEPGAATTGTATSGAATTGAPMPMSSSAPEPVAVTTSGTDTLSGSESGNVPFLTLARLRIGEATVAWYDEAVEPRVDTALVTSLELGSLVLGSPAPPATLSVTTVLRDVWEAIRVDGTIDATPGSEVVELRIDGRGLRAGPLASYLPSSSELALRDGRFRTNLGLRVDPHGDGGKRIEAAISNFEYRDGEAAQPFVSFDRAGVIVGRLDLDARIVRVDELAFTGLDLRASRAADGAIEVLGLRLLPTAAVASESSEDEASTRVESSTESSTKSSTTSVATTDAGTLPTGSTIASTAASPTATTESPVEPDRTISRPVLAIEPPLVEIDAVRVEVSRIAFTDHSRPESRPLVIDALSLVNATPLRFLGPEPEAHDAAKFVFEARIDPLIENVRVDLDLEPFATEPSIKTVVAVSGIRSEGLFQIVPELAETLDSSEERESVCDFGLRAELFVRPKRRGVLDSPFAAPFALELAVRDIAWKDRAGDKVLLGLDALDVHGQRIDPSTGDVHLSSIEFVRPHGFVELDAVGLHVLGLVVKVPSTAETGPTSTPTESSEADSALATAVASGSETPVVASADGATSTRERSAATNAASQTIPANQPEIRVDRITISGIDFTAIDARTPPAMVVPLSELEIEVRGVTTRALVENRPIRFSVYLASGEVELEKRLSGGVLSGAMSDVFSLVVSGSVGEASALEKRRFFEELSTSGTISFHPHPNGDVKFAIGTLDLANLRGPAKSFGVELSGGLLDVAARARIDSSGAIDLRSRTSLTDSEISEPPDGPIYRYLHLPAPLEPVLFALRDENGTIGIPLSIAVPPSGRPSLGALGAAASSTFLSIITNALAAAPVRVVGSVLPLDIFASVVKPREPLVVDFAPASARISQLSEVALASSASEFAADETLAVRLRHELGRGDLERALVIANPSPEHSREISRAFRDRRASLEAERADAAERLRAAHAAGLGGTLGDLTQRVRALDREIGLAERGIDDALEFLRPGAERAAPRRATRALIALGTSRLAAVRQFLIDHGVPATRIDHAAPRVDEPKGDGGGSIIVEFAAIRPEL
jgi:hypothetical protein